MKKLILGTIMLVGAYTLSAQRVVSYQATDINFRVPPSITTNFQATYPGFTPIVWEPVNDWWYATYKDDNSNRMYRVYYNTQPYYLIRNESTKVALPVINTFVPEEVITSAIRNYGNDLYSITGLKTTGSDDMVYQVTFLKKGVTETIIMDSHAVVVTKDANKTKEEK